MIQETTEEVSVTLTGKMYITSDQKVFLDEAHALRHSLRLEDETIQVVTCAEAEAHLAALTAEDVENELETMLDELTINE